MYCQKPSKTDEHRDIDRQPTSGFVDRPSVDLMPPIRTKPYKPTKHPIKGSPDRMEKFLRK